MDTVLYVNVFAFVVAVLGSGAAGGLLVALTVKRGPQGKEGHMGFPGPTGAQGRPGDPGEPGKSALLHVDEFKLGKFWIWRGKRDAKRTIKWEMM